MGTPYLVQTAWAVVMQLVEDWQKNPSIFCTEHDVQAELYSRLKNTLLNIGEFYIKDRPNDSIIDKKSEYYWPRLNCEYSLIYKKEGGRLSKIMPDIVLWDDIDNSNYQDMNKRYSKINDGLDNWPILWTCEIKFDSNITVEHTDRSEIRKWFRIGEKKKYFNHDMKKMKALVSYGKKGKPYYGTQYAAVLNLVRVIAPGDGFCWDPDFKEDKGKLWMLHAYLPEKKFIPCKENST